MQIWKILYTLEKNKTKKYVKDGIVTGFKEACKNKGLTSKSKLADVKLQVSKPAILRLNSKDVAATNICTALNANLCFSMILFKD